jgi:hypothetical protein
MKQENLKTEKSGKLYVVLKLQKTISCTLFNGLQEDVEIKDCAGFIPVYDNLEQATEVSADGKYQIMEIKTVAS